MSKIKTLWLLGLVAVMLLTACGPTAAPTEAEATQPNLPKTITAVATDVPTVTNLPAAATKAPTTDSANPTPVAVATSRGPNLEATDPSTVQLASGGLQLVEFFRFT